MTSSRPDLQSLTWAAWPDLTGDDVYALMRLRSQIFVVEQACIFLDLDGIDPECRHLLAHRPDGGLAGALRVVPPNSDDAAPSIGRVVVDPPDRGTGLGRRLMIEAVRHCRDAYPGRRIHIGAQERLQRFYTSLGFEKTGPRYLEDGIWHIPMHAPPAG